MTLFHDYNNLERYNENTIFYEELLTTKLQKSLVRFTALSGKIL